MRKRFRQGENHQTWNKPPRQQGGDGTQRRGAGHKRPPPVSWDEGLPGGVGRRVLPHTELHFHLEVQGEAAGSWGWGGEVSRKLSSGRQLRVWDGTCGDQG